MRKERKIINTNIRLDLCNEQDRQAWEYLQTIKVERDILVQSFEKAKEFMRTQKKQI